MQVEISIPFKAWHKPIKAGRSKAHQPQMLASVGYIALTPNDQTLPEPSMTELLLIVGRERDIDAFEALFRHFAPRIKAFMRQGAGGLSAEELMQETMVAVWNKAVLYDASKGAASTWIYTIARNLRIDAFRRARLADLDPQDPVFVVDGSPLADSAIESEQQASAVRAALKTLPADQRQVLELSFFEDKSQSAIAACLNLPLGTVKSRMRLAFAKLRTAIGGAGEQP